MDKIKRNKELMKKFETMINTADKNLANELIADDASFYTPASSAYGAMIHGSDWCPSAKVYQLGLFVFVYLFIVLAILIFVANMVF